jgi:CRISPR-associated protein Cas2
MSRRHYLISYDVADDKRRNRVFQALRDHGDHAQFSVFFCQLSAMELAGLRGILVEAIHTREDQVLIVDLGEAHNPLDEGIECIGQSYQPPCRVQIV